MQAIAFCSECGDLLLSGEATTARPAELLSEMRKEGRLEERFDKAQAEVETVIKHGAVPVGCSVVTAF